ncbi:phage tail protein [Psychrobacter sp. 72-O-c]|uniref:phage tail-collar fiber domain-containing protein n=1 Tax=Psychrobacter sp. 72-O-c TaxID=2774125 RepID=UPI00191B401B|nr:phage tail protein [Psychrobacter sp. 72-O-c]
MTYQLLLTTLGQQKIAAAANAGSPPLRIAEFAVGQGINVDFSQRLGEQVLVSKRYQAAVQSVAATAQSGQYEITCIVPQNQGGWFIRELGLIDGDGDLIWVGQLPEVQKPVAGSTAAVDYRIKAVISIDNPDVNLVIDANVVTATQSWARTTFVPLSHLADTDPHDQYASKTSTDNTLQQLNEKLTELLDRKSIKVGDTYTTTINHANADAVATHHGYGTWARFAEGRTLVGLSTKSADPADYKTIGNEFGENEHTLTLAESASHAHDLKISSRTQIAHDSSQESDRAVDTTGSTYPDYIDESGGGDQPHNNIQPSRVVGHWLRTA